MLLHCRPMYLKSCFSDSLITQWMTELQYNCGVNWMQIKWLSHKWVNSSCIQCKPYVNSIQISPQILSIGLHFSHFGANFEWHEAYTHLHPASCRLQPVHLAHSSQFKHVTVYIILNNIYSIVINWNIKNWIICIWFQLYLMDHLSKTLFK